MARMGGLFGGGGPQNWADVLSLIGAGLKDASPVSQGGNLEAAQNMMLQRRQMAMQQQALAGLPGLFGGQAAQSVGTAAAGAAAAPPMMTDPGTGPTMKGPGMDGAPIGPAEVPPTYAPAPAAPAPLASGPDFNRIAAAAPLYKAMGLDLAPSIEALKAAQPNLTVSPSGETFNTKDPSMAGKIFPSIEKGQIVLRDARGNPIGVMNLPGVVAAQGQSAGAIANAQEAAKAAYDLVPVPQSDGSTRLMPRSIALAAMTGQGGAGGAPGAMPGAGGAASGVSPTLGISQSPAQAALATKNAEALAARQNIQPKEFAALQDLKRSSDLVRSTIHGLLGDTQDPRTGQWSQGGAVSPIGGFSDFASGLNPFGINGGMTAGAGAALAGIPGTASHNVEAKLDTIRANTAFDELQKLRDESPTGAGLGRVTQQEINLLSSLRSNLDQGQSAGQLKSSLRQAVAQLDKIAANREALYNQAYSGISGSPSALSPARPKASSGSLAPPQPGDVRKGYRFRGGNPADPNSWARVQ